MKKALPELPAEKRARYKKDYEIKDEDVEVYVNDMQSLFKDMKQRFTGNIAEGTIDPNTDLFKHVYDLLRREVRRRSKGGNQLIDLKMSGKKEFFDYLPEDMQPMRQGFADAVGAARNNFKLPDGAYETVVYGPDGEKVEGDGDVDMLTPKQRAALQKKGYKFVRE